MTARTIRPEEVVQGLEHRTMLAAAFGEFVDPNPNTGNRFGDSILPLSTGNVVITSPGDDAGGADAGAVYLFSGASGKLISTLRGSSAGDQIGSGGVTALTNGNYVVKSPLWDNGSVVDAGAVTFGNGITGLTGVTSAANSLVGLKQGDMLGFNGIEVTPLSNGNYVVGTRFTDNGNITDAGAVTFGNGLTGTTGIISVTNSLLGTSPQDQLGNVYPLTNGNYVVSTPLWDNGSAVDAGAVTFASGTSGIAGTVSTANSLVGTTSGDGIGSGGIKPLPSGNYVILSSGWDNGAVVDAGAVTFASGSTGITGTVNAANSLVGSSTGDFVGVYHFTVLSNGNYVVSSPFWSNGTASACGAVTFGSGLTGIAGPVAASNSLIGSQIDDNIGETDVVALNNGNYVVISKSWNNGGIIDAGAVTLCNGTTGRTGVVSSGNSLVGSRNNDWVGGDGITALTNGNYVVISPSWDNGTVQDAGAVTFVNGTTGLTGPVNTANSLVGSSSLDQVGRGYKAVVSLSNGNYVIASPDWDNGSLLDVGAVTFGNGTTGVNGVISAANSLLGSRNGDNVGSDGIYALANGNYVVASSWWDDGLVTDVGAVTFASGVSGIKGQVSSTNSLVGRKADDFVGYDGVETLPNGNYVVASPDWHSDRNETVGAYTFGSGASGIIGAVSPANSLVGVSAEDSSWNIEIKVFSNGNYVVSHKTADTSAYDTDAGSVTFGNSLSGVSGIATFNNSVFGLNPYAALDNVVEDTVNKSFYVHFANEGGGRIRVGSTETGPRKAMSGWFVDPNPRPGNVFGATVAPLSSGNVIVTSPGDDAGGLDAGAVYLFDGRTRQLISRLTGSTAGDAVGDNGGVVLSNGNFVVQSPFWNNGSVKSAGAVTLINGVSGLNGIVSSANSLVGTTAYDRVGYGQFGVTALANGNFVVASPDWDNGTLVDAGAVTFGNGTTGVQGVISASNSLLGSTANDAVGLTNFGDSSAITPLTNGNYVIASQYWDNAGVTNVGAVTFASGTTGIVGTISSTNSLIGSSADDQIGTFGGVTALANGNYVVASSAWDKGAIADVGAVTFGNGTTGIKGVVSVTNSLVGSSALDSIGAFGVTALKNGNYVIASPYWNNGAVASVGAVTFGNGTTGITGIVSTLNSLTGSTADDQVGVSVAPLSNGNYAVASPYWNNGVVVDAGACTFGNGTTGIVGAVATTNSLVGSSTNDSIGLDGVFPLTNGNCVVASRMWNNGSATSAGAATLVNGTTGLIGVVSSTNSLVGSKTGDQVGEWVTALTNGNYVVSSSRWDNGATTDVGAVTFSDGAAGRVGVVSAANSLVGLSQGDSVGNQGVDALKNGNYLVLSSNWDNGSLSDAGAVTFGNGTTGISGFITDANSLVGEAAFSQVGLVEENLLLDNGNYVVDNGLVLESPPYSGAATFGSGLSGVMGKINIGNSIIAAQVKGNLWSAVADNVNGQFYLHASGDSDEVYSGSQTDGFSARLNPISDVTINEDAAEQTVSLSGIYAAWGQSRPLKVTATSNNTALLPNPGVTYVSGSTTGTVKFKPVGLKNGSATVTITVEDGGPDGNLETVEDNAIVKRNFTVVVKAIRPTIQSPSGNVTQQRPKLQWTAVPGAVKYDVWIANSTTMQNPFHKGQSVTTSYDVPVDLGIGKIDVWVRAILADGSALPWSAMQRFNLMTAPTLATLDVRQTTARPSVSWGSLYGATSWDVWVSNVTAGGIQAARTTVTGTTWTPSTDLPMARYRIWVRALGAGGFVGAWSTFKEFYVAPIPTVVSPVNPTFNRRPVFDWSDVAGATSYGILVKNVATGGVVADLAGLPGSTWTPATDLTDGVYAWWGIADSSIAGFRSSWTARTEFNVGGKSSFVGPVSPVTTTTPLLKWLGVDGAVRYELWVNGDTEGAKMIFKTDVTTNSFQVTTPWGSGRTYRMWVRAVSSDGRFAAWSDTYVVTVAAIDSLPRSGSVLEETQDLSVGLNPQLTRVHSASHQQAEETSELMVTSTTALQSKNVIAEGEADSPSSVPQGQASSDSQLLVEFFRQVAGTGWLSMLDNV